jgi:hypothetical protein
MGRPDRDSVQPSPSPPSANSRSELDTIDHVLRGALNAILLNLELLAPAVEPDEKGRALLDRASSGLRRLATELLPAAFGIMQLEVRERRPVDLAALAARACAEHGLKGPEHGERPVSGDAELLALAVGHVIDDAVAATPAGSPPPRVAVEGGEGVVVLVVRSAFAGAASFTPDGMPAARGQLGGLVAVTRVARLHGGMLTYERRPGELIARLSIPG